MEVHAHTHTARKKWTHYLWEFLMLFLAVFCGFLAENLREHRIEHQREKQFIKTLAEDIRNDTADLNRAVTTFSAQYLHIDSLIALLADNNNLDEHAQEIYRHGTWIHDYYKVTYFDRTIAQLKSSGNFRLIRHPNVSRLIMEYDGAMNNIIDMQNLYVFQNKEKMLDCSNTVFKTGIIIHRFTDSRAGNEIALAPPYFLTKDSATINRFINQLYQYLLTAYRFIGSLKNWGISKAVQLDSLIKKEYHVE